MKTCYININFYHWRKALPYEAYGSHTQVLNNHAVYIQTWHTHAVPAQIMHALVMHTHTEPFHTEYNMFYIWINDDMPTFALEPKPI
jgi:hypothetical protein